MLTITTIVVIRDSCKWRIPEASSVTVKTETENRLWHIDQDRDNKWVHLMPADQVGSGCRECVPTHWRPCLAQQGRAPWSINDVCFGWQRGSHRHACYVFAFCRLKHHSRPLIWELVIKGPGLTLSVHANPHFLHALFPAHNWDMARAQSQLPFPQETLAGINWDL